MSHIILDELVFQAAPLGEQAPVWPPDLQIEVPVGTTGRSYRQTTPLFARRAPMAPGDTNWPAYCGLLKDLGIPLQTSLSSLETLAIANIPARFARRTFDEGFVLKELETAEALEISCIAPAGTGRAPRLPLEINAWHELKQLIDCLRNLTGATTPIGIGMIAGDVYADICNALAARVDFVILEAPTMSPEPTAAELNHLAWCVVAARLACEQSGSPRFPIFVDTPLTNIEHLIKLLALGATAISIDALVQTMLPQTAAPVVTVPKGLLSGIGSLPVKTAANLEPLTRKLSELIERLRTRVYQQQHVRVGGLNRQQLRALTPSAAHLCAVQALTH